MGKYPYILRSNISFGWDGLHNARYSSLLSGQVALGGNTGITTLAPAGFEPVPSRTAVEHTYHSTTDATKCTACTAFINLLEDLFVSKELKFDSHKGFFPIIYR